VLGRIKMVTIKDISKACNVSTTTVSKALNGYKDISDKTRDLVLKTAREMHYFPNAAARQLKTNMSHNIGVLFVDETNSGLAHEYFSTILNSAKEEAERLGYDMTFISKNMGRKNFSYLDHARYRKVDGVLIASINYKDQEVINLVNSEIPTISIDYAYDNHSSVMSDNIEGAYELTKFLINKGHKKIAFIHGEKTSVTEKRLNGFFRACKEGGILEKKEWVVEAKYHDTKSSEEATEKIMKLQEKPTAIMYPDDFAYLGGLNALEKLNLSVPGDVSVVGYDGVKLTQVLRPKLTTYYQNAETIGVKSIRKLVEIIEQPKFCVPEQIMVGGKIIEGGTVKDLSK
jgi:LacI family transcriptional regulator